MTSTRDTSPCTMRSIRRASAPAPLFSISRGLAYSKQRPQPIRRQQLQTAAE
jgi:hypothetical protein